MASKRLTLLIIAAALIALPLQAQQMVKLGNWMVHYSALPTTFLSAPIAKSYGISRSKYLGLLNITVLDASKPGLPAKQVKLSGTAKNLLGNLRQLNFKQLQEQDAVYYIAEIPHRNEETYQFTIEIQADGQRQQFEFKHTFYSE